MRSLFVFAISLMLMNAVPITAPNYAQERQMGGLGITVFVDPNFNGKSATFRQDIPDLRPLGLDDRIRSLRVGAGEKWEVCEHANYQGRCVVVSGEEPDLRRNAWDRIISSLHRVAGARPPLPPSVGPVSMVLFDRTNFRGNPTSLTGPATNLNRRAQSVTIGRGVWELCDGRNFSGRCITVNTNTPDLARHNMRNRVASARPVAGATPPATSNWYMVLFDEANYRGNPTNFYQEVSSLNRRAGSVTIGDGVWELCSGRNFTGKCVTLTNSVPDLRTTNIGSSISSLRPLLRQPRG